MSLQFSSLKSPQLGYKDKITVGKLSGCRICDVIHDHHEYLIWAEKAGIMKYKPVVIAALQEYAGFMNEQVYMEQEVKPWLDAAPEIQPLDFDKDVPF